MNLKEIIILHRNINSDSTSSDIDPEKDNYFSLVAQCINVSVYVPDEDFEKYQRNILYLEDNGSLYKLSELQNDVSSKKLGDIDGSGKIDVTDLTELSLFLIGDRELTADQQLTADIDADGAVTLADLARLQQYLSKKIEVL